MECLMCGEPAESDDLCADCYDYVSNDTQPFNPPLDLLDPLE